MPSLSTFLKATIAAFVVTLAGDILWHNVLLADFYFSRLTFINGVPPDTMSFPPWMITIEMIAAAGSAYFVLRTSRAHGEALFHGALLGLLMVGPLNFINHSLILKWDTTVTAVDTLWGVALGAIGGLVIHWAGKKR